MSDEIVSMSVDPEKPETWDQPNKIAAKIWESHRRNNPGVLYKITPSLRWVITPGTSLRELQQAWLGEDGSIKWEPVPVVKEGEA